jgi:hypothetical protein
VGNGRMRVVTFDLTPIAITRLTGKQRSAESFHTFVRQPVYQVTRSITECGLQPTLQKLSGVLFDRSARYRTEKSRLVVKFLDGHIINCAVQFVGEHPVRYI